MLLYGRFFVTTATALTDSNRSLQSTTVHYSPLKADPRTLKADPRALKADPRALKAHPRALKADPRALKANNGDTN